MGKKNKPPEHICYEDNQGMCHNGCDRILNEDTARGYFGNAKVDKMFEAMEAGDPQGWAERNLQKIQAEEEIEDYLTNGLEED
jgi:hypothetical protein